MTAKTILLTVGTFCLVMSASGCGSLVIEKTTTVVVLLPDSEKVEVYYVAEGISVLADKWGSSRGAVAELKEELKSKTKFEDLRFGDGRLFVDEGRERKLCADWRATVADRKVLAKALNKEINTFVIGILNGTRNEINDRLQIHAAIAEHFAHWPALAHLFSRAQELDNDSLREIKRAAQADFDWLRYEPYTIRLVLPVTQERAKTIANDPETAQWIEANKEFVRPVRVEACAEGLAILLGDKTQPLRLTRVDPRDHFPSLQNELIKAMGMPQPVLINGKAVNAERLIESFIKETMGKQSTTSK